MAENTGWDKLRDAIEELTSTITNAFSGKGGSSGGVGEAVIGGGLIDAIVMGMAAKTAPIKEHTKEYDDWLEQGAALAKSGGGSFIGMSSFIGAGVRLLVDILSVPFKQLSEQCSKLGNEFKWLSISLTATIAAGLVNTLEGFRLGKAFQFLSEMIANLFHGAIVGLTDALIAAGNFINSDFIRGFAPLLEFLGIFVILGSIILPLVAGFVGLVSVLGGPFTLAIMGVVAALSGFVMALLYITKSRADDDKMNRAKASPDWDTKLKSARSDIIDEKGLTGETPDKPLKGQDPPTLGRIAADVGLAFVSLGGSLLMNAFGREIPGQSPLKHEAQAERRAAGIADKNKNTPRMQAQFVGLDHLWEQIQKSVIDTPAVEINKQIAKNTKQIAKNTMKEGTKLEHGDSE